MNDILRLAVIIFALFLFIMITYILKKGRMPIKYSLVWYFADLVILACAIFPVFMSSMAKFIGFEYLSNMVLCMLILILIFISIILTIIIAGQTTKINLLMQEVSLLKSKVEKKDN